MSRVEAAGETIVRDQEARAHERYLVRPPSGSGRWAVFPGFHGDAESSPVHLDALSFDGGREWTSSFRNAVGQLLEDLEVA